MDHATNDRTFHEQEQERLLRDRSELEGALLPTAQPVDAASASDPTVAITAGPVTYFEYDDQPSDNQQDLKVEILDAPTIPAFTTSNDPDRDKMVIDLATRKGLVLADQEIVEIMHEQGKVHAANYYNTEDVKRANQRASVIQQKEDAGLIQISAQVQKEKVPPPPLPKEDPEHHDGTYCTEYKVSQYEVKTETYETADYDVSEYKSVYES